MMATPLDLSPGALRRRFPEAFVASRCIYWTDFLVSTAIGWVAFVASGLLDGARAQGLAYAVAVLGLYRAVLFIHELTHLRSGSVPGFAAAWNLLVGLPLMVPSIMYVGSHADHHKRSTYGTADDPEYEPMAFWSPLRIVASTLVMGVVPGALALRWGVIGPLSRLVPRIRPFVVRHLSTLAINPSYRRAEPRGRQARRWWLEETGAALVCWAGVAALASGAVGPGWLVRWYGIGASIGVLNHLRTLAAHRYALRGAPVDVPTQLADTWNVEGIPVLSALFAPVGLRFHALHHLVPSVPYHRLGPLHRALRAGLPAEAAYHRTEAPSVVAALGSLLASAARNARHGAALSAAHAAAAAAARSESRIGTGADAGAR
jgi:fatty acid desaturase